MYKLKFQKFVQKSGLLKHKRRACKHEKKDEVSITDEEKNKIIQIALAQYETLRVFKKNNIKFEVTEEIKTKDDEIGFLDEIKEESYFFEDDVKEDQEECWVYEYLDEAIEENPLTQEVETVKTEPELKEDEIKEELIEEPLNEFNPLSPVKKIIEPSKKAPKKPRKLYNEGIKVERKRKTRILHPNADYICDLCGNHYKTWSSISNHVTFVHKPVGDIFCEFCDKSFKSKGNYKLSLIHI